MYYLGIVGAKSSLGQGVIAMLQKHYPDCKIVFRVDDRYPKPDLLAGEFQSLEQVLSHGITPTLVLDFGLTEGSFERAKFYRTYGIPAVMQIIFGSQKLWELENIRGLSEDVHSSLVLVPDFSVIKSLIMKALKTQLEYLASDVDRVRIDVLYNTVRYNNYNQWIYWAQKLNAALGKTGEYYRMDGHMLNCGIVQNGLMNITSMDKNEENINVQILSKDGDHLFNMELRYNLLSSRIKGVSLVLDWYFSKQINCLTIPNQVFIDVLPDLI